MEVRVTKIDILSGYLSKFILLGANFITLPVILRMLSAEEVGMNYIMISVGALVQIADFGFSAQIGRNITYVISGAQRIYKKDIEADGFKLKDVVRVGLPLSLLLMAACALAELLASRY